jgi:signal transduction histidine kinase
MENETGIKIFFWIGTAIMLLSVLGIVLIVLLYRTKVHDMNRKESDALLHITLETEKKERKRIASDLHDSVSGDLSAVQNYITILYRKEKDDFKKSIFLEVESTMSNILANIGNISYNLMPPMLDTLGLVSTLKSYFERVRKWNEIAINEEYYAENIDISSAQGYELYRIIQELVTNAIKHGKCSCIDFAIRDKSKYIILEVTDDGNSFDFYKSLKVSYGMGLKNITSRIKYIGAQLMQIPVEKGKKIQIHLKK